MERFICIGEKIHVIAPSIRKALEDKDPAPILDRARAQIAAGAHYIDANIGPAESNGPELMEWIVKVLLEDNPNVPLALDTANAKAIEAGLPKQRIEEASARRQARIDGGMETIAGLTKYRLDKEQPLDILDIDNSAVREAQVKKLEKLRANRDNTKVRQILEEITKCAETGNGNLLELSDEAAKARAS